MRSFPGPWHLLSIGSALAALCGCAESVSQAPPSAPPPRPALIAAPEPYSAKTEASEDAICRRDPAACPNLDMQAEAARPREESVFAVAQLSATGPEILLTGPLAAAPAVRGFGGGSDSVAAAPATPPAAIPTEPPRSARTELLDVEAHLEIDVEDIEAARAAVTRLVQGDGGQVINEVVQDQASSRGASLSLRVPSERVQALLTALRGVGRIRSQKVETREVSRAVDDAEILVANLGHALQRYQELLAKAANVSEALAVEAELQRVRTSLERVQGDLAWLRDRVARSTVYVTLAPSSDAIEPEHVAKLHPGLLGSLFFDVPPAGAGRSFAGPGLSLAWSRGLSMDLALLKRVDAPGESNVDCALLTLGTELYSDFLGGGRRRWLNPYFGFRGGYARELGENALALGGTLGLELTKTEFFTLDVQGRAYALLGLDGGVHAGLEPLLSASVAY